jgi:nucleoside-diphosphate-sugar epimerase
MKYITGANSFVGRYLVPRLDSFIPIPHQDIDKTHFSNANRVFFLSTYGNMHFHTDDNKIVKANVSDLVTVTNWIDWGRIDSFIFMSTSSVKRKIQTTYSRTKRAAEEILLSFMEKYDAPISIIRPLSITGVGEQKEHLIPTLIRSCLYGEEMDFVSEPRHDFIDVTDVVNGIMTLSDKKVKGIFELGTGVSYSNKEVLEIVENITKKKAHIHEVRGLRSYDDTEWVSDNFKARGYGWLPTKKLEDSIREMVYAEQN